MLSPSWHAHSLSHIYGQLGYIFPPKRPLDGSSNKSQDIQNRLDFATLKYNFYMNSWTHPYFEKCQMTLCSHSVIYKEQSPMWHPGFPSYTSEEITLF